MFEHGYKPGAPRLADLLAAMFLHGGFMHLFGNMLFLWIYGDNVEHRLGPARYLFWYLMTGVAATLFFSMLAPGSLVPMVGASGAISGVLGFYFVWFPRNVVRVLLLLFPILVRVVEIPARIVLGVYLVIDNVLPMLVAGGQRRWWRGARRAHRRLRGWRAGSVGTLGREVDGTPKEYRAEARAVEQPRRRSCHRPCRSGDMAPAARAYFAMPAQEAQRALTPAQSLALGEWLANNGHALRGSHGVPAPRATASARARARRGTRRRRRRTAAAPGQPARRTSTSSTHCSRMPAPHTAAAARAGLAEIAPVRSSRRAVSRNDHRPLTRYPVPVRHPGIVPSLRG